MANFVLTAKSNIPLGAGLSPIPKCEQKVISVASATVTASTLFTNYQSKDVLAQQLNKEFGTGDFFNRDNVMKFSGYFKIKQIIP